MTVPEALVDDLGLMDVDRTLLVRESIAFLLDREPAAGIAQELSLDEIARRYPNYHDELRTRVDAI